jgi:hypothetical protein
MLHGLPKFKTDNFRKLSTEEPYPKKRIPMEVGCTSFEIDFIMRIRNGKLNRRHYPNTIQKNPCNFIFLNFNKLGKKALIRFPPPPPNFAPEYGEKRSLSP